MRPAVEVELVSAPTPDARLLVDELENWLSQLYTSEQQHGLDLEAIFQPHIRFFIARVDGAAAGCGGIALFEDFGELKRMYVREGLRGRGIADAIVARLEEIARAAGLTTLK